MNSVVEVSKIFELIKCKDESGVNLLYEKYFHLMYGIAFSVAKNEEIAKDAVQNTTIKIWSLESEKLPRSHELTWLYTVTKNETLALLRKEKTVESIDNLLDFRIFDKNIDQFIDMDSYYSLIKNLSEKQREIVTLKVLGQFTHKEISNMLGEPIGTIQWHYNVSIKKLRNTLTSFVVFALILGVSFFTRFTHLMNEQIKGGQGETEVLKPEIAEIILWADHLLITTGIAFAISLCLLFIFFIHSEKIPTKPTG